MNKTVRREHLDTVRVGREIIEFWYYPLPAWYGWTCSNGDSGTAFRSLEAAQCDAAQEVNWILDNCQDEEG